MGSLSDFFKAMDEEPDFDDNEELKRRKGIWKRYWGISTSKDKSPHDAINALSTLFKEKEVCGELITDFNIFELKIFAAMEAVIEISNNGFYSYYSNSCGDYYLSACDGLHDAGAEVALGAFKTSFSVFPESEPAASTKERNKQLLKIEKKLNDSDLSFFDEMTQMVRENQQETEKIIIDYFKKNQDKVIPPEAFRDLL